MLLLLRRLRWRRRLLLLLLLELLLVLLWHLRHRRRHARLEALLGLRLAGVAGELRLEALGLLLRLRHTGCLRLHHGLLAREAGILLGQGRLAEARRLGRERAGLLLLLLLRLLAHGERATILLLLAGAHVAAAAQEGVRIRVHGGGERLSGRIQGKENGENEMRWEERRSSGWW